MILCLVYALIQGGRVFGVGGGGALLGLPTSMTQKGSTELTLHLIAGDVDESNPVFKAEDFIIIIQTPSQKDLLKEFGSKGVCCDATHNTTGYDFMLTTLLVLDDYGEGQPVAWCLSNHETLEFLIVFFRCIKDACGQVKARWFMAGLAPQAYDAFCIVMEWNALRLFCIWHVDKAWREELLVA